MSFFTNSTMDFYGSKNLWKFILFLFAILIGVGTLLYTESFLEELRAEEIKRVNLFATAFDATNDADNETVLTMALTIIGGNTTIPMIITDENGRVQLWRNIDERHVNDSVWMYNRVAQMDASSKPIEINGVQFVHYENSILLTKLRYYPVVLLLVISLFIVIAYIAFSNVRKSEQNRVWNGLAKETAHQIGTPLTSLMGWMELLREKGTEPRMVEEMEKDILRLNTITERFSKIGSQPTITTYPILEIAADVVKYLKARTSSKIEISFLPEEGLEQVEVMLNKALFEWVLENLIRNAIDAIDRAGTINIRVSQTARNIRIEVEDSGKGIPQNKQKMVFRPGYTTKQRGWGLGLSLAKRIIEQYHGGRIYVASSELGKGTTFRIQLPKKD